MTDKLTRLVRRAWSPMLISILACGCIPVGDTVPSRYYSLPLVAAPAQSTDRPRLMSGPFEIPGYLDRPQIVIRKPGNQLRLLDFDRWAEPLDQTVLRRINSGLRSELASASVYDFPNIGKPDYDYRVKGKILIFEADSSGTVTLQVSWSVDDSEGSPVAGPFTSTYTSTAPSDDIAAVVTAMGELLDRFSATMAAAVREEETQAGPAS